MNGKFYHNKTPLTRPGTKALIFEAATRCAAWAPHRVDGWYLGPAMHLRQCKIILFHKMWFSYLLSKTITA